MDIKPCPFCGGLSRVAEGNHLGMAGSTTWAVYVECRSCAARGPDFVDGAYQPEGQRAKAIAAWNRRV